MQATKLFNPTIGAVRSVETW